jgi:branched-chain amino acid aminotransferase
MDIELMPKPDARREEYHPEMPIGFGRELSDHMFLMDYTGGKWHSARIVAVQDLSIPPNAVVLHYAAECFEGAKAFQHQDKELYTFRLDKNAERFNESAKSLCMPEIPEEYQLSAIEGLLDVDRLWFPQQEGACLYIRPFMIGKSRSLAVTSGTEFTYCVLLSPSGAYFGKGLDDPGFEPIKLLLTTEFKRVPPRSVGSAKAGGNYAASLQAAAQARVMGAKQVLYLDVDDGWLEEAGAMNHWQVETLDGEPTLVIPSFTDTILESITTRSMISLEDRLGIPVLQEHIPVIDFLGGLHSGRITEAGGFGTAAAVCPVGTYILDSGDVFTVGDGRVGPIASEMYNLLTAIQRGTQPAPKGWMRKVPRKV